MARNGSGVYSLPPGSVITNGDTSDQTDLNTPLADLAADANIARPIVAGGTGATSAAAARTNLGLGTAATTASTAYATAAQGETADAAIPAPAGLTQGDLFTVDASGDVVRVPLGAAGQALVVNSGATAPEWGDRGLLRLAAPVTTITTAVAVVEFSLDHTKFRRFELEYENVVPAADGRSIVLQVSADAGATWRTSGYHGIFTSQGVGAAKFNGLYLSDVSSGLAASGGVNGKAVIYGAGVAGVKTQVRAESSFPLSTVANADFSYGGSYQTAEAHNRLRVLSLADGNLASGRFTLRGEPV